MKKESPLRSSISLLIGIVIAILALVRGRMLLPLLLAVLALWLSERATASARSPMNWCWTTGRASPVPFPRSVRFAGRLSGSAEKRCAEDE